MDVLRDRAFAGDAGRLLCGNRDALLAKDDHGLLKVAFGFGQGLLAIHHGRSGFVAELFDLCCRNIHSSCAHKIRFKVSSKLKPALQILTRAVCISRGPDPSGAKAPPNAVVLGTAEAVP